MRPGCLFMRLAAASIIRKVGSLSSTARRPAPNRPSCLPSAFDAARHVSAFQADQLIAESVLGLLNHACICCQSACTHEHKHAISVGEHCTLAWVGKLIAQEDMLLVSGSMDKACYKPRDTTTYTTKLSLLSNVRLTLTVPVRKAKGVNQNGPNSRLSTTSSGPHSTSSFRPCSCPAATQATAYCSSMAPK